MSYIIQQNPLNQGSLAGRYSLKDLSNTGKYTGYINALPIRRVVTCTVNETGTSEVTVAVGSLMTVPNGVTETTSVERECDYMKLSRDISISVRRHNTVDESDPTKFIYILYDSENDELVAGRGNVALDEDPYINGVVTELSKVNLKAAEYKITLNSHKCSLPIGYFDGGMNWHVFNAIGFVDNAFWVEEDVEALFPDGRDENSNFKNNKIVVNWLTFTKFSATDGGVIPNSLTNGAVMLLKSGKVLVNAIYSSKDSLEDILATDENGYYYVVEENRVYQKISSALNIVDCVKLCDFAARSGKFYKISNLNLYKPVSLAAIESRINTIRAEVDDIISDIGDLDFTNFFNKNTGGIILGKTEYAMTKTSPTEITNREYVLEVANEYARLDGAVFTGRVNGKNPTGTTTSEMATVGWTRAEIDNRGLTKQTHFNGAVTGTYNNLQLSSNVFTENICLSLLNNIAPNYNNVVPLEALKNYKTTIPGWIQWVCNENDATIDLKIGDNLVNMFIVGRVRAANESDACGSAVLVPIAAGQYVYSGKNNYNPTLRFIPMRSYSGTPTVNAEEYSDPMSQKTYYEIV